MVAYLEKSEGSKRFHEIIDFLNSSHIKYALTKNPTIYVSFIKQFWRTATANTRTDGKVELTATIDRHVKTITEASLRIHLKLEDNTGVTSLQNSEIFEQIALIDYETDFDKLTFQKGNFSPQWRITSSPSLSPESSPSPQHTTTSALSTSQPQHSQPLPAAEEHVPTPHDLPLHSVHSYRSDKGRLQQTDLTDLLNFRVKKLEKQVKSGKARRRARSVLSEDEDAVEDSSKQGRKIFDIDEDPNVSLIQDEEEEEPTELVEDQGSGGKDENEVSTARAKLSTGKNGVNTASGSISTAAISTASKIDIALSVDEELAKKLFEEEHARFNAEQEARAKEEQEQEKSDFDSDSIKRYQALKRKPISVAQARKNMIIYLKNMVGYKMKYFKGMSYDDIRPIFEVEYNKVQTLFKNKDVEEEKGQEVLEEFAEKTKTKQKEISKKTEGLDEEVAANYEEEKKELRMWLTVVPDEEATMNPEILHTRYTIVHWESKSLGSEHVYKIITSDGNTSYHKTFERNEVWRNQQDWTLISWRLYENCGIHTLLLDDTLISFHMLVEKRYPFTKEMLEKMLNWRLEAEAESTIAFELLNIKVSTAEVLVDSIDWNTVAEQLQERQSDTIKRYQALKRKPISVAQARKNNDELVSEEFAEKSETEQGVKEISKKTREIRRKSLARKRTRETQDEDTSKKQKHDEEEAADYEEEKEELRMWLIVVSDEEETIIRADGNTSYHKTFESMLKRFDRQDLVDLHGLVMKRFKDNTPEGYNLILLGDLKTISYTTLFVLSSSISIAAVSTASEIDIASGSISTAAVSTASEIDTAAAEKAKEKGKGIMIEPEPPKKLKKRVQVELTVDEELAKKLFEEECARFNAEQEARAKEEQEQEKSDFEVAQELQKQLNERRKADSIDWNTVAEQLQERQSDTIKRYQALKRKPISVAQARKNMMIYLKNMAGYKMEYFKGMSYDDIRPIFEVEYNKVQTLFKNKDVEEEKGKKNLEEFAEKTETEQGVKEISKKTGGMRRKSLARKRTRETQDEDTSKR
ncbi:hypothetical protein Tco_0572265 [Tanacetum coccineum]